VALPPAGFCRRGFNPTLVRLALFHNRAEPLRISRFNPTLVRLARYVLSDEEKEEAGFNPTLVRLAPGETGGIGVTLTVSIPPWFD